MSIVTTILGDIEPARLGYTSMHEHLNAELGLMRRLVVAYGAPIPPAASLTLDAHNLAALRDGAYALSRDSASNGDIDFTVAELGYFAHVGGRAVVDASPIGLRGDVTALAEASRRSGVHVVFATGLYVAGVRPDEYDGWDEQKQYTYFLREVTHGVGDTGLRPGILKCGLSTTNPGGPLTAIETATLRALGRVSAETGLSLHVHTAFPMSRDQVVAGLEEALATGMEPARLVMMHMDSFLQPWDLKARYLADPELARNVTTEIPRAVLDRGANIGFDSWGQSIAVLPDDYDRAKGLVDLLRRGYGAQIGLGHDVSSKPAGKSYGGQGFTRFPEFLPPLLTQLGFGDEVFTALVVDNPARILAH